MKIWKRNSVPLPAAVLVVRVEGFRSHPYRDSSGVWTIGCGATREADGSAVTASTTPITLEQAHLLCQRDLQGAATDLGRLVRVVIDEGQAAALISWVYNLGQPRVTNSTLLWRLNNGQSDAVPAEFAKWNLIDNVPSLGLTRRRWAEAAVCQGADPDKACDTAWAHIINVNQWPAFDLVYT